MSNQIDVLDSVREILLAIVPAMCGIAMPLLLQAIERIDAKYQSIGLVELFKKECIYKVSTRVLILSCFYFIYIMLGPIPSMIDCWLIENSAAIIGVLLIVVLFICFFLFCKRILVYYNPIKLNQRLIYLIKKKGAVEALDAYRAWVEIIPSIVKDSDYEDTYKTLDVIKQLIEKDASEEKTSSGNSSLPYLNYSFTTIIEGLCRNGHNHNADKCIDYLVQILLNTKKRIPEAYYNCLWMCIRLFVQYDRDDLVYSYWASVSNHYEYMEYEVDGDIHEGAKLRRDFFEFNIFVGALILYKKKYGLLNQMLSYKINIPSSYPLCTKSLSHLVDWYKRINELDDIEIEKRFPFPDIKGTNSVVLGSANRYMSLLYLNTYKIEHFYSLDNVFGLPVFEQDERTLRRMDDMLSSLEYNLKLILNDKLIIEESLSIKNVKSLIDECVQAYLGSNILSPLEYIKCAKGQIEQDIDSIIQGGLGVDEDYVESIHKNIATTLAGNIQCYLEVFSENPICIPKSMDAKIYGLMNQQFYNSEFAKGTSKPINTDEYLVHQIWSQLEGNFSLMFMKRKSIATYRIDFKNVLEGIKRLGIDETYTIVSFNVNWRYFMDANSELVQESSNVVVEKFVYDNISIFNFGCGVYPGRRDNIYIMRNKSLPKLSFSSPEEETIKRFGLTCWSPEFQLYLGYNKLSDNPDILTEEERKSWGDKIFTTSLYSACWNVYLEWKKDAKMINFVLYHESNSELIVKAETILPFEETQKKGKSLQI